MNLLFSVATRLTASAMLGFALALLTACGTSRNPSEQAAFMEE